jgi:glutamyl-Q tRNA(Asp) synthetase
LHLGHAHSALFAQKHGTSFILRIEDIDPLRCRPQYIQGIFKDLDWLGLTWEQPVRYQSQHMNDYQTALDRLQRQGVLYPCFCTRSQIQGEVARSVHAPHGPDGALYPGTCRVLSQSEREHRQQDGQAFCLRLDVAKASKLTGTITWTDRGLGTQTATPEIFGDVVLARKDTPASYHLAVVVDDALQSIDLVTRGQDLRDATHIHRLLQGLLDLPTPLYHHHGLLLGPDGQRLAKRNQSQTLSSLRQQGYTPQQVKEMAGFS